MRLRSLAVAAGVLSAILLIRGSEEPRTVAVEGPYALPGPMDVVYAAPYDANYSYGPKGAQLSALRAQANVAPLSFWQVTYDSNFNANPLAKAAFEAAVLIWSNLLWSPVPIRVKANFANLGTNVLGSAGPTALCPSFGPGSEPNTLYAAALADKLAGAQICSQSLPPGDPNKGLFEITASFSSGFPDWDYKTDGTGDPAKYNFMTVVMHELGHGAGFYGSFQVSGGIGSMLNPIPDIYDRFAVTGAGTALLSLTPAALGAQLTSNDTFFNGTNAKAAYGGQNPKLETHDFSVFGFGGTNVFVPGSSYSHLDDVLYSAGPNGLQTWQLAKNEVYTDPGPIMRGVFLDEGWTFTAPGCSYSLAPTSANATAAGGTGNVTVTAPVGCPWTAVSHSPFVTITSGASGTGNGVVTYSVAANSSTALRLETLTIANITFTIAQSGTVTLPTMSLDKTSLQFAVTANGATIVQQTGPQTVRLLQSGAGTVPWTATSGAPWLTVTPTSGTGAATLTIGVQSSAGAPFLRPANEGDYAVAHVGAAIGAVTLAFTGASNTAGPINVGLKVIANGTSSPPTGNVDTPSDNATGLVGSIAVTGWAVDDLGIASVKVFRDPMAGEGSSLVFIGDAVLVEGARSDIAATFPTLPRNTQAGWGYLMLTNFLPNQGTGTYRITVIATDVEGKTTTLGVRTITCANSTADKPFGAVDRPNQGEVVSGSSFANFGWALARGTIGATPPDGGSVTAFVDGASIGSPAGWSARPDLTAFFPVATYANVSKALAVIGINTTALTNGVHTIFWIVTASNGQQDGIGSRFFSVANSSLFAEGDFRLKPEATSLRTTSLRTDSVASGFSRKDQSLRFEAPPLVMPADRRSSLSLDDEVDGAPLERRAIAGRRGYDLTAPLQSYAVTNGRVTVRGEELDRIELQLGGPGYTGYLRAGDSLGPLPIGSRLDEATGVFTWGVGVGFIHDYDLVFVRWADGRAVGRQEIRITLGPKHSNLTGTQVMIDAPASAEATAGKPVSVERSFLVGGWAADLDETAGTGVDTLHVWAYPSAGGDPIFLGATAYGGERPDVAAIFGEQFKKSGYGLIVDSLPPGTYDLAVFAWSTVKNGFVPAKVVRVTVR